MTDLAWKRFLKRSEKKALSMVTEEQLTAPKKTYTKPAYRRGAYLQMRLNTKKT